MRVIIAMVFGMLLGAGSVAVLGAALAPKGIITMKVNVSPGYAKIDKNSVEYDGNPFMPAVAGTRLEKGQTAFAIDDPNCYFIVNGAPMYIPLAQCP